MHVLWDFDNTLARCPPIWPATFDLVAGPLDDSTRARAWRAWQSTFPWTRHEVPRSTLYPGEDFYDYLARTLEETLSASSVQRTVSASAVRDAVVANLHYVLIDGACDALDRATASGHINHLASNHVPDLVHELARLDLRDRFRHTFISATMGHEKPSAGFWELIEATIGADRSELVMVGDDYMRDIEPTVARGYRAIWVATPEKRATLMSRGAHTADSIDEVPALL